MNRRLSCWVLGALGLLAAAVFAFYQAGHFLDAPAQEPEKANLILALGGDNGGRSHRAAELYKQGYAPKVLLTGMAGGNPNARRHHLHWRATFLVEQGVPENALIFDDLSASSWDEAVNTLRLMQSEDLQRVLVVSDPPHLRRLDWVWRKVFAGSGKEYRLVASRMDGWDAAHWWRSEASAQFVIMEYIKLAYYGLKY